MRTAARQHPCRPDGGFTLLELLVAMTLLALLAVMLSGGLRLGMRAWERQETRGDDSPAVRELLRRSIEGMLPVPQDIDDPANGLFVNGTETSLAFTTETMAEAALGGRYLLRIEQEDSPTGARLVASWRRLLPGTAPSSDVAPVETRSLLESIGGIEIAYLNQDGEWVGNWANNPRLPRYVRVRLWFRKGDPNEWPELVVQPQISADVSCLYGNALPICEEGAP